MNIQEENNSLTKNSFNESKIEDINKIQDFDESSLLKEDNKEKKSLDSSCTFKYNKSGNRDILLIYNELKKNINKYR